jgi:hypothetical protein
MYLEILAIILYFSLFVYLYYWLSIFKLKCECLDIWHYYHIIIYIVLSLLYFIFNIVFYIVKKRVFSLFYNLYMIYTIVTAIIIILFIINVNKNCKCYSHISKELLTILTAIIFIVHSILYISYIYRIVKTQYVDRGYTAN